MILFMVPARGAFSVDDYLARDQASLAGRFRVVHYEDLPALTEFPRATYVLAGLDQLSAGQLRLVSELYVRLSGEDGVRFLNRPGATRFRLDLLRELARLGRNDFRAIRAGDDLQDLRYPVFLRSERGHGGALSPLLNSMAEVEQAIGRAVMRGHAFPDLLVIEFCSTLCPDGIYRKYSAFIVGDRIMGRSLDHGTGWMLKFGGTDYLTRPLVLEEQRYVMENPHAERLKEIFAIAGVEYGRIDYSLKDDRVQTWEINLNATIGRGAGPDGGIGPRENWPIRDATREYFFDRFREAWAEVDGRSEPADAIQVRFTPAGLAGWAGSEPSASRPLAWAQSLLRPFKQWLDPVTRRVLRKLGATLRLVHRARD